MIIDIEFILTPYVLIFFVFLSSKQELFANWVLNEGGRSFFYIELAYLIMQPFSAAQLSFYMHPGFAYL